MQNEPLVPDLQLSRGTKVSSALEKRVLVGHANTPAGSLDDQVAGYFPAIGLPDDRLDDSSPVIKGKEAHAGLYLADRYARAIGQKDRCLGQKASATRPTESRSAGQSKEQGNRCQQSSGHGMNPWEVIWMR